MKRLFNYIPAISITFTLTILFCASYNLLTGSMATSNKGILELFFLIVGTLLIDFLFSYTNFKNYKAYCLSQFLATYVFYIVYSYIFHIFGSGLSNLVTFSIVFTVIYYLIYAYFSKARKLEAEKINKKLSKS